MKIMKKHVMLTVLTLFLLALLPQIMAEQETLGTFKQDECIELIQTCSNCTQVNITNVKYPNSSVALSSVEMEKEGTFYNYSFCNTNVVGQYIVNMVGDVDGIATVVSYDFFINPQGFTITEGSGIIYSVVFIGAIILFLITLYFGIGIPWQNNRNNSGDIVSIDYKKYLKIALIFTSYLTLIFVFAIGKGMSYSFLQSTEAYGFFNVGFYILLIGLMPSLILTIVFLIIGIIFDKKIQQSITRGLPIR